MSTIQRNNTVIDISRSTDLATAISKYTSGGVMLTDAIGELAKSLTILLQDQMGYSNFQKRHNSCKFDLHRECFYFWGHDAYTGQPVSHIIHEWPSAGDDFTFGDGVTGRTASRTEIRQFAKDLPGFLEKLQDDLMSTGAESEGKAERIACLADRLRECNLIILKRQQDRPDRGPWAVDIIEPFVDVAMKVIREIDDIPQTSIEDRHAKYANLLRSEMRLTFQRGVAYGEQKDRPDPGPCVAGEDNQLEPFVEAAMNAILKIDEVDQTLPQPYRDRHTEYAKVLWEEFRRTYIHGLDQGAAALNATGKMEIPPWEYEDTDPRAAFKGPIPVQGIRFFSSDTGGNTRRCVKCGDILDLFVIKVLDKPVAVIGLCSKGETYLYMPSDYPITEDIRQP